MILKLCSEHQSQLQYKQQQQKKILKKRSHKRQKANAISNFLKTQRKLKKLPTIFANITNKSCKSH
jgi:triacylglycerol esterase/lipase EstA (alpha/beta hydrolase family)